MVLNQEQTDTRGVTIVTGAHTWAACAREKQHNVNNKNRFLDISHFPLLNALKNSPYLHQRDLKFTTEQSDFTQQVSKLGDTKKKKEE